MANLAGIKTIRNQRTGSIKSLIIDVKKARKTPELSEWIEDILDHLEIQEAMKKSNQIPWDEAKKRIDKKFGFK